MIRYVYRKTEADARAFLEGFQAAGGTGYYVGRNGDEYEVRTIHGALTDGEEIDEPEDSPTVANCDDWGTGEGAYHGRI